MKSNKALKYGLLIILAAVTFLIYRNSLNGDFLIDDYAGILDNSHIHNLQEYFSKYFNLRLGVLGEATLALNWFLSGANPFGYHLFNVLVHTACVLLFFIFCNVMFKNIALSFLTSLIFAIHPIHTEAVSWISGGPYAFSSLFFISAMIFYVQSNKSIFYLLLTVVFFGLCFFVGNSAPMLPVMFICYDVFFREADDTAKRIKRIRLLVAFSALVIATLFISILFINKNRFAHLIFYHRGLSYLVVIIKALAYYLKILFLPLHRGLYHPFAYNVVGIQKISPAFFLGILVLCLACFCFFKFRRSLKPVSFGIIWFFMAYAPYSNIIPICNIISERYLYLASAGYSIIIAALFLKIWEIINKQAKQRAIFRGLAVAALTLFLGSYTVLTIKRNYEYNDIFTYWETNINNFPDGHIVYNNLAGTFYCLGQPDQAIAYSWVNLMINPNQAHVWCNLGKVYREKGDIKWARHCYEQALKVDKGYFPAQKALGEMK